MGNKLIKQNEYNITVEGLYNAGKSTMMQKLKHGEVTTSCASIGFSVESLTFQNFNFDVLEIGGRCSMRPLHRHFWEKSSAVIFVVDSCDKECFEAAKYNLHSMLKEETLQNAVVLILANKQDLVNAVDVLEMIQVLDLHDVKQHCNIFGTCATTGEGMYEGLLWLKNALENNDQQIVGETMEGVSAVERAKDSSNRFRLLRKLSESLKNAFVS